MNFDLPDDIAALVSTTKDIVNDLLPLERAFQETGTVPSKVTDVLVSNGYYALPFPEEFGGLGLGALATVAIQAELAYLPPQFWADLRSAQGPASRILLRHGSDHQRSEILPQIITGSLPIAFALTEPHCGSDVSALRTTAKKTSDGWVLNGSKTYISNGLKARLILVVAYTDRDKGSARGLSVFLVPSDAPGYSISGKLELMGTASPGVAELSFDDLHLPDDALIGEVGRGFAYVMDGLNEGRLTVGATALGMGEFALKLARDYAMERPAFGGVIADFQAIQHMLADMALDMHAARLVALDAAWRFDRGDVSRKLCSMTKLICSEAGGRTVDKALQIFGGAGYVRGQTVERLYRDVRVTRIYEGASEVQRNTIARDLLKQ